MKITIKTRIWLLGLVVLGGVAAMVVQHYRVSDAELVRHSELLVLLGQMGQFSRAIHEVQRERGLSTSFLSSGEEGIHDDLRAQHAATDFKLHALLAALPQHAGPLAAIAPLRARVLARALTPREAFEEYTMLIGSMLGGVGRLTLVAGGHPLQSELVAHAHLIRAKEFFGQVRATLLALPPNGIADAAWMARMGRQVGLFDWHVALFYQSASADIAGAMRGALDDPDMKRARDFVDVAMAQPMPASGHQARRGWYETLTSAVDLLREMERYSLAGLMEKAETEQRKARLVIWAQRSGLMLISFLLVYLAISSLRLMLRALEAALQGARRAAAGRRPAVVSGKHDEVGEISHGVGDLLALVDRLNRQASTDALTKALNRHGFAEIAHGELLRARRYRRCLSMIVLDLDNFKQINDRYGHAVGDRVLQEAARLVGGNLRLADVFVRWGGEEFVVLAPETSAGEAERLAEKLRVLFRESRQEGLPPFTASFGVAAFTPDDDVDSLFARADHGLYLAKRAGRDCVVQYPLGVPAAAA